ncbi:MAG: hypothetical protein NZ889_00090 [Candidatus Pacearchaeota archaeon]|nr:hypothetical protein [Candidatus Pacearchaeota archaeon]
MGILDFLLKKKDKFKEIRSSFKAVKEDIRCLNTSIEKLNEKNKQLEQSIDSLSKEILKIKGDIDEIKNKFLFLLQPSSMGVFKHQQTGVYKQTGVEGVQTPVQTRVQTPALEGILRHLSMSERTIVFLLLNSDIKMSCEDLAVLLGKQKSTIRGQINSIKQKSEGLIKETIEKNGKKRYYLEEKIKEALLSELKQISKKRKSESSKEKQN